MCRTLVGSYLVGQIYSCKSNAGPQTKILGPSSAHRNHTAKLKITEIGSLKKIYETIKLKLIVEGYKKQTGRTNKKCLITLDKIE